MSRLFRERAGTAQLLVQAFTNEHEHSYLNSPEYVSAMRSLLEWIDHGSKPTPQSIAADCAKEAVRYEGGCAFNTEYEPQPYDARVAPRGGPRYARRRNK